MRPASSEPAPRLLQRELLQRGLPLAGLPTGEPGRGSNPTTIAGLKALRRPDDVAALRGKSADEGTPGGVLRAYRERKRETDLFAAETR